MESDDRELRLRSHFGFMMVWTALTIGVFGYLLGIVLEAVLAAIGLLFGFTVGESSHAAVQVAGHVLVGMTVILVLVQSYLAPELPTVRRGDE